MTLNQISKGLIIIGVVFIIAGLIFWFIHSFIGLRNIPGTLRINIGGITFMFPVLLSIILSLCLTLILNVIARLMNK